MHAKTLLGSLPLSSLPILSCIGNMLSFFTGHQERFPFQTISSDQFVLRLSKRIEETLDLTFFTPPKDCLQISLLILSELERID